MEAHSQNKSLCLFFPSEYDVTSSNYCFFRTCIFLCIFLISLQFRYLLLLLTCYSYSLFPVCCSTIRSIFPARFISTITAFSAILQVMMASVYRLYSLFLYTDSFCYFVPEPVQDSVVLISEFFRFIVFVNYFCKSFHELYCFYPIAACSC